LHTVTAIRLIAVTANSSTESDSALGTTADLLKQEQLNSNLS